MIQVLSLISCFHSVGCHRSAKFVYHKYIDTKPVGYHTDVCALLKAMLNQCTPQPIYIYLETASDLIKCQLSVCENLSDKILTHEVYFLMTLLSASRASAIHHLDVRYIYIYIFYIKILIYNITH